MELFKANLKQYQYLLRYLLILGLFLHSPSLAFSAEGPFAPLYIFPAEISTNIHDWPKDIKSISINIFSDDIKKLQKKFSVRYKIQASKNGIRLEIPQQYLSSSALKPSAVSLESTFLLDYKAPEFVEMPSELQSNKGLSEKSDRLLKSFSIKQTGNFVYDHIEKKESAGMLPASVTLKNRNGDCKAHAVLAAALARRSHVPARVVVGVVLALSASSKDEHRFQAFGHAWSEVYLDKKWQLLDATQRNNKDKLFYLPFGHLQDESESYDFGVMNLLPILSKIRLEEVHP